MTEETKNENAINTGAAEKTAAEAKAAAAAAKKAEKEAAKAAAKAEKEAAKAAAKAAKEAEKEAKKAAKQQPEQNGVRRPGPDGKCGQAWALMDSMSSKLGAPVPVGDVVKQGEADGLNPGNVRAEYARWKKFHGIVGRTPPAKEKPAAPEAAGTEAAAQ